MLDSTDKRGSRGKIRLPVRVLHTRILSHVAKSSSEALDQRNILCIGSTNTRMKWFHSVTFLKFFVYLLHCFSPSMIELFPTFSREERTNRERLSPSSLGRAMLFEPELQQGPACAIVRRGPFEADRIVFNEVYEKFYPSHSSHRCRISVAVWYVCWFRVKLTRRLTAVETGHVSVCRSHRIVSHTVAQPG
jgi:hypothetical protein